jgi:hypothetical protein
MLAPLLLVSSCNPKTDAHRMLLAVDPVSWAITPLTAKIGVGATGICTIGDDVFVAAQSPEGTIVVLDMRTLRVRNETRLPDAYDVHSVAAWEGGLAVASTGSDEVLWYRYDGDRFVDRTVLWAATGSARSDTVHVNGLAAHDDRLVCCAFGPGFRGFGPWDESQNGFVYDIADQRFVLDGLDRPHTVTFIGDELFLCESARSNFRSAEREIVILDGYTRGVAALGDGRVAIASSGARTRSRSTGVLLDQPGAAQQTDNAALTAVDLDGGVHERVFFGDDNAEIYDIVRIELVETSAAV